MIADGRADDLPLVVDLDGTLLRSDLLMESGYAFLKASPLRSLAMPLWLTRGKAHLKSRLAESTEIDIARLPYNVDVIDLIKAARTGNRRVYLATASHRDFAEQISRHLGVFDGVFATEETVNLSAESKRRRLVDEFGERGFDYAGNSRDDLAVWASSRRAYLVDPDAGVETLARRLGNVERVFDSRQKPVRVWTKALRLHQWLKNLLIFVPLLASHRISDPHLLTIGVIAFFCFGLCASSVYVLNDLLDVADDRRHPTKQKRPFAAGALSLKAGTLVFPLLMAGAFGLSAWLLPWQFTAALGAYYLITLLYSLWLKQLAIIDVMTLAILYTTRIIAGTLAFGVKLTFWMLAFSVFIFLSLAFVKRCAELWDVRNKGRAEAPSGRGYLPEDLEIISSFGPASGYLSVMVLALYIQDASTVVLYRHPEVIWLACPLLLFWISRIWLLTHRGHMHEDPVIFAIRDRVSILVGIGFGIIFWLAA